MTSTQSGKQEEKNLITGKQSLARTTPLRGITLGLLLLPANAYFIIQLEIVRYQSWPSILSLSMNSLFILFVLALFNYLIHRRTRRFILTPADLIAVFVILNLGTVLAGQDQLQVLVFTITHPTFFATTENGWDMLFIRELPQWLLVTNQSALDGFYRGNSSLLIEKNLMAWMTPLACWTGFLFALFWVMVCINTILRKQWMDNEHLTFPTVQLPIAVATTPSLVASPILWIGFALSSIIALVNGLSILFPGFPSFSTQVLSLSASTDRPWSALGGVSGSLYPFAIGLGMLMPADLAFSCWFFLWFQKLEAVACSAAGLDNLVPEFPFIHQQAAGALIGISFFVLWSERRHLLAVMRKVLGLRTDIDDSDEPLRYRHAVLGIVAGMAVIMIFCTMAGLSLVVTVIFFLLYLAIAVGVTRMRAEMGAPVHDIYYMGPETYMIDAVGTAAVGRHNLSVLALFYWLRRQYGGHPMPVQLEGMKMAERSGMRLNRMIGILMIAVLTGTLVAFLVLTGSMYHLGAKSAHVRDVSRYFGGEAFSTLENHLTTGIPAQPFRLGAVVLGGLFASVLLSIRMVLPKWPFHPLGFALAGSWYMQTAVWLSIFAAWLIKVLLLRYGGHRAFIKALPFFFGLILGDCVWGMMWLIYGIWSGQQTYSVWF